MGLVLRTPPSAPLLTVEQARLHARIDETAENALLESYIAAATAALENWTGRAFLSQTWDLTLDDFPRGADLALHLPRPPLIQVQSVSYIDADGAPRTLDSSGYQADPSSLCGRILPAPGADWPATQAGRAAAATVRFSAGYGPNPEDVPADLRHAAKLMVADMHNLRETHVSGTIIAEVPLGLRALLAPFIVRSWA